MLCEQEQGKGRWVWRTSFHIRVHWGPSPCPMVSPSVIRQAVGFLVLLVPQLKNKNSPSKRRNLPLCSTRFCTRRLAVKSIKRPRLPAASVRLSRDGMMKLEARGGGGIIHHLCMLCIRLYSFLINNFVSCRVRQRQSSPLPPTRLRRAPPDRTHARTPSPPSRTDEQH